MRKITPEQIAKRKASDALAKKNREAQTIIINDKWKIVRLDALNWAIIRKGHEDRPWYYARLLDALQSLPHKILNEGQKKDMRDVIRQLVEIKELMEHLRFYKFIHLSDDITPDGPVVSRREPVARRRASGL